MKKKALVILIVLILSLQSTGKTQAQSNSSIGPTTTADQAPGFQDLPNWSPDALLPKPGLEETAAGEINLSGIWIGTGYVCEGAEPPEKLRIEQEGNILRAIKITGDACVPAGRLSWRTTQFSNTIPATLSGEMQVSSGPNKSLFFLPATISLIDEDTIRVVPSGASTVVYTRKRLCPADTTLSGPAWVDQFPGSQSTSDLVEPFKSSAEQFISALNAAGASVSISSTYRPLERTYLMHYAFRIAKEGFDPKKVPAKEGVKICWLHTDTDGRYDLQASIRAANQMVKAFDIVSLVRPALTSNHTKGLAIDMTISWVGTLQIVNASGTTVFIDTTPRNGMNTKLWRVGKSYGAIHFNYPQRRTNHTGL